MIIACLAGWLASTQPAEIRTEVQVEADPPDRRAELAGEISCAQGELEEVRRVMETLPNRTPSGSGGVSVLRSMMSRSARCVSW